MDRGDWTRTLESGAGHATAAVDESLARGAALLGSLQRGEGWWCGELEGDSILQSEFILLEAWRGRERGARAVDAARQLLVQQDADGGWRQAPGTPLDISASVKAYFALKLTGTSVAEPAMCRAREAILANGGADSVNSYTRFYLALLGQISYDQCPAVPPEAMLLPTWAPINIYRISSWSRTILVPLSLMWSARPARKLPAELGVTELFHRPPEQWPPLRRPGAPPPRWLSWETAFRWLDRGLRLAERWRLRPLRRVATRRAERWMLERFADSDGLGAIFPPIVWSIVALKCLGYADDSPAVVECDRQLEGLMLRDAEGRLRLQPCLSPVWDTALSLRAMAACRDASQRGPTSPVEQSDVTAAPTPAQGPREAGEPSQLDVAIERGVAWLRSKQVRDRRGDWARTVRGAGGGWFFEHRNAYYPDVDDTIMALMALDETGAAAADGADDAVVAGRDWLLAMQNRDGGWGAFDKDNDAEFLCEVPFADHNAMIDPSTPDITGRVLESLCRGAAMQQPRLAASVARGVAYLVRHQEADGSWFGRWGINHIYGTWQALVGLRAAGMSADDPTMRRGVDWLLAHQQPGGGWGETAESYLDDSRRGTGPPTPSQTAWALLGLLAARGEHDANGGRGDAMQAAIRAGAQWLVERQREEGGWDEPEFTGTGFPRVFYLRYHLYPLYFPLLALAACRARVSDS